MKNLREILESLKACDNATNWVGEKTIEDAIKDCSRGDWMLWLAERIKIDDRQLTLAAARCAETVSDSMSWNGKLLLETAIQYGLGRIDKEEVTEGWGKFNRSAILIGYADKAAYSCCSSPTVIYGAAAYAATAKIKAREADGYNDMIFINYQSQAETSNICREILGDLIINRANEMLK